MGPMTEAKVSGGPNSRSTEAIGSEGLEQRSERNHRRRGWSLFALLILVIGVTGSLVGGWSHYSSAKSAAKEAFDDRASAAAAVLTAQLQHNIDLDGLVRALIGPSPVSRTPNFAGGSRS